MLTLHIIVAPNAGQLTIGAQTHVLAAPAIVLLASAADVSAPDDAQHHQYTATQLQPVYRDLRHLLAADGARAEFDRPHPYPVDDSLLQAVGRMAAADADAMLHFVCAYVLSVDGARLSALLHQLAAADQALFAMIESHALRPWPATRYADALGLPLRKLNYLFQEKYGVSAKHWLLTRRLEHARELLQSSSKKIIDVALESGFCSPAHFSDSFRRHFHMSPSDVRRSGARSPFSLTSY